MRAFVLQNAETNPRVIEMTAPIPQPDESLCTIQAAAFNHRDHWLSKGAYPNIQYPTVLGSDGCATVLSGPEAGNQVIFCPSIDWGENESYQAAKYSILGMPRDGTFAEQIAIPTPLLQPKPPHLTPTQAASLPLAGLTAFRALFGRAQLQPGEKVLISGVGGGVALFAMQFAIAHGAEVYVTSSSQEKIQKAMAMGAQGGVCYQQEKWHKQLPKNFDVVVDSAGGPQFGLLVRLLGMGGRLVFYGGTLGKWSPVLPQHLFFRQISLLGSTMGSPNEFIQMCSFVTHHKIVPVIDRVFPLEQAAQGLKRLTHPQRFGKVVVQMTAP